MANRTRRHPGRNGGNLRPDRKVQRQEEAAERQAKWDSMDDDQRKKAKAERGYRYNPKAGIK